MCSGSQTDASFAIPKGITANLTFLISALTAAFVYNLFIHAFVVCLPRDILDNPSP